MSNSNERANNKNDPYAPKWVRESPRLVEDPAPQRQEQPVPKREPVSDPAHAYRVVDASSAKEPQSIVRARVPLTKKEGAERSQIPRFLDPQFFVATAACATDAQVGGCGGCARARRILGSGRGAVSE